jgi:transglutaminase-like putative cysteine protease
MRFDIVYETRFSYDHAVAESQNELRAAPTVDARQQVVHYDVRTTPSSRVFSYTDYWGTRVDAFGIRHAHDQLVVVAEATVETSTPPVLAVSPRFTDLTPALLDEHREYLERSTHVDWGDAITDEVAQRRAGAGDDLVGFVLALHRLVGTSCTYAPGATYVGVPVDDVWAAREGVCQDFAHLLVAACRAGGVPARYVSGYLFARDESDLDVPDPAGDRVTVQTHAWVEVAVPGYGWLALDPTNRQQVGERHVKIGHGRDYDDVAPLRGVYAGGADHTLDVTVDMRRAAAVEAQVQQQQQ